MGATTPAPHPASPEPCRPSAVWQRIQGELRRAVDAATYDIWLAPLTLEGAEGGLLTVAAPDTRKHRWVAERFAHVLDAAVAAVLGPEARITLVVSDAATTNTGPAMPTDARAPQPPRRDTPVEPTRLNPRHTFDQCVIGEHNRLAHAAALAVAELPGTAYNPLFIYGPPGVGKTHLLQSIANYVTEYAPSLTVRYSTAERFTNEFTAALQAKDIDRFKAAYRSNDVLLVDDVQFLERKARTEEEFFHTFNTLYESGAQLVLTSDRTPRDLKALEDRLRERFASGLVTDIRPPDLPTRLTVLRKRAALDAVGPVDDAVLVAIAERIEQDVRTLEGALIGVVAYASLTGRPLSVALVEERLGRAPNGPGAGPDSSARRPGRGRLTIAEIQHVVCERFGLTREELLSPTRTGRIAWPRQVAMHLAREELGTSLPAIGAAFGGRNHTTVLHAIRRTKQRTSSDAEAREAVRSLTELLRTDRTD